MFRACVSVNLMLLLANSRYDVSVKNALTGGTAPTTTTTTTTTTATTTATSSGTSKTSSASYTTTTTTMTTSTSTTSSASPTTTYTTGSCSGVAPWQTGVAVSSQIHYAEFCKSNYCLVRWGWRSHIWVRVRVDLASVDLNLASSHDSGDLWTAKWWSENDIPGGQWNFSVMIPCSWHSAGLIFRRCWWLVGGWPMLETWPFYSAYPLS